MEEKLKHIILGLILLMLSIIVLVELTGIKLFEFKPLGGYNKEYKKPELSIKNWMNSTYQDSLTNFKNNNIAFKEPLIRIYNEYNYRLFKTTKAPEVVIGIDNQCFQIDYIREYTGEYFVGQELIMERCSRLKYLQDTLNKMGKNLLLVFAPGKASYMPENIPDHFKRKMYPETNYQCFTNTCKELEIPYLDLQNYYNLIKDTVSWPLYPTYGIHWSDYGMYLALDTFINYVADFTGKEIPSLTVKEIQTTNIPRGQDNDIAKTMNLLFEPAEKVLAYPVFDFSDTIKPELNVLFVGDSFLFHWFKYDLGSYLFRKYNFWYYNVMVYPEYYNNNLYNYQLNIRNEITSRDLIVLECTERFLYTAFWNFEEIAYQLFNPDYEQDAMIYHINDITKDHKRWLLLWDEVVRSGKTMQECLLENAATLAKNYKPGTVEFYEYSIRNSPSWLNSIEKQAQEQGVPLDDMIHRNAVWMSEQKKKN